MSYISKPVDWEIFNIPPAQSVQYYSILKKKREFTQLIKQYDAQVLKQGYLHYCGIVPKKLSSSLNSKCEIFIVFFDETPTIYTSFIGFRVKVSKDTFIHESNSLLLFLKKSKKAVFYLMNNNCIHVQCRTSAWQLFYLLYDDYLRRRYVLTVIGTQFFCYFVYSYCIQREVQLLEILFKGSKVIRVSKKSIYYKIHRKRKISVTDLIYMTLNMPKNKRYIISSFSPKESILYSDMQNSDFYTVIGSKINISKLRLKKYKKQKHLAYDFIADNSTRSTFPDSPFHTTHSDSVELPKYKKYKTHKESCMEKISLKRKFTAIEDEPTTSKFQAYRNLKPYTVKSYSCINTIVPNLLRNGKFPLYPHTSSTFPLTYMVPDAQETCNRETYTQKTLPNMKIDTNFKTTEDNIGDVNVVTCMKKKSPLSVDFETNSNCIMPRSNLAGLPNSYNDTSFTTATGKSISISASSMFKAQQLIANDFDENEVLQGTIGNPDKTKMYIPPSKINFSCLKRNKNISIPKISENKFPVIKNNEIAPKMWSINSDKNMKLDSPNTVEEVEFSTAAGKTINISNTAMEAAKKLIQDTFDKEMKPVHSTPMHSHEETSKNIHAFNDIGCSSKTVEIDMNKTLVEKFFEDTTFDEKEFGLTEDCNKIGSSNACLESKNKTAETRKPRKSLGGRRSIRYCSDKL